MKVASWPLKIAGRECVAGLAWTPLAGDTDKVIQKEYRQALKKHGSAHGVLYKTPRYAAAGAVRTVKGSGSAARLKKKLPVAAWLAESVTRPTIYIAHHDAGYWVLVADDKHLDDHTDVVIGAQNVGTVVAEIVSAYQQVSVDPDIVLSASAAKLVTSFVTFANVREAELEQLLSKTPPKLQVAQVLGVPLWAKLTTLAAVVLVALGVSGYMVNKHMEKRRAQQELQAKEDARLKKQMQEEAAQGMAKKQEADSLLASATSSPAPHAISGMCINAWRRSPKRLGGWVLEKMSCQAQGTVELTYSLKPESGGTELSFRVAAARYGFEPTIDWFNKTGTIVSMVGVPSTRRALTLSELPTIRNAGIALASRAQRLERIMPSASFSATKPSREEKDPKKNDAAPAPPFLKGKVEMSGESLRHLMFVVPNDPHVSIERVEFTNENGNVRWSAAGAFVTATT